MKVNRFVFSDTVFEHTILTKLIFSGHSIGTFVKDGFIFHRCLITDVNKRSNILSGRWLGMTPSPYIVDGFKAYNSFQTHDPKWRKNSSLQTFYLGNQFVVYLPNNVQPEDEVLVQQLGNPYALQFCPLR